MDYEKLGAFYLGTTGDPAEPVLYDSRDLTTHAVCVGMTGSGKTGLCIALIEEALIDGVPVIAIDPKGDLGNLMLTFPNLAPSDFAPWIAPTDDAAKVAERWRAGLAASGQSAERISRLRAAGDVSIYTPGGDAGIPLSVLKSFRAPLADLANDGEAWRDRVEGAVSGLLALVGIAADPLRSREHVLLSQILDSAWHAGRDVELATLIQSVTKPPFAQVGAFDLETFFPAADRMGLALQLNTLLASPSFAAWSKGKPLEIGELLFTSAGKPRVSILSIAHLGEAERMFFVTILLNEVIGWMRTQAGTSSLRAIVFMDEVAGYLPPVAMPPAKKPMLTLLKQARAYGVGMVLATQNPVDVDYNALSNAGTWFLGRLQTERDKARVIEGLEGASAAAGAAFDRAAMETTLAGLQPRQFVLNNVHDDHPIVFTSRFVMSYLAGPLTRTQIRSLMGGRSAPVAATPVGSPAASASTTRPIVPAGLDERFAHAPHVGPAIVGTVKVHYTQAKSAIDEWRELTIVAPLDETTAGDFWEHALIVDAARLAETHAEPAPDTTFAALPAALTAKSAGKLDDQLAAWVYRNATIKLFSVKALDLVSTAGESETTFRSRLAQAVRESRDAAIERCRLKYRPKLEAIAMKQRTAADRVAREKSQATAATTTAAIDIGASVLGAIFGGRRTTATKVASAARSATRTVQQRGDVGRAEATAGVLDAQASELAATLDAEIAELRDEPAPEVAMLEIAAKKADTAITRIALVWLPV
ncbi:ATP-binding protein [soil metagenome]